MRMSMRRFTRLTNAFSKKLDNTFTRWRSTSRSIASAVSIRRCACRPRWPPGSLTACGRCRISSLRAARWLPRRGRAGLTRSAKGDKAAPMKTLTLAATMGLALLCTPASAETKMSAMRTGNEVLGTCEGDDIDARLQCSTWASGVVRAFQAVAKVTGRKLICFPSSGTMGQYRDVIVKHIRDNPRFRDVDSGLLALGALSEAFPCPNSN
jgi:hypothetical protein